jgi:hypothetical protein
MIPDADDLAKELLNARPLDAPPPNDAEVLEFLNQRNRGTGIITEDEDIEQLRRAVRLLHRPFPPRP